MIRLILPALLAATPINAQDLGPCRSVPYSQKNCARVLACIGENGLWFDGRVRGWGAGSITGYLSDDTYCKGSWTADGPLGAGLGEMSCEDGLEVDVLYYSQDDATGTAIGGGTDNKGRNVQVWSGENVLQFLTGEGAYGPALPCVQGDIPIS